VAQPRKTRRGEACPA